MQDYQDACRDFSVAKLEREVLQGSLADELNAAVECCDRWADDGRVALHWISKDFAEKTVTFRSLSDQSAQFANLLRSRGIGQGDVVGGLLPRIPELLIVALGASGGKGPKSGPTDGLPAKARSPPFADYLGN
jgi:acetyl-CoA synthetase